MANPTTSTTKVVTTAIVFIGLVACTTLTIAKPPRNLSARGSFATASGGGYGYGQSYSAGYGGFYSPYAAGATYSQGYSYAPSHWWTGPNGSTDPVGEGYNPNSGYAWDSVSTLLLETSPAKSRITLDGIALGTTDTLGPFQLPPGDHTLRVEYAGYEPSVTVLHVEKPVLQQLQVNLTPVSHGNKPAPAK